MQFKTENDVYSLIQKGYLYLTDIFNCVKHLQPFNQTASLFDYSNSLDSTNSSGVINQSQKSDPEELPICIMKNNKVVFAKASFQNGKKQNTLKKQVAFINKGQRGSKFRGVSKNGNQWQVLIMVKKRKNYFGSYDTEYHAARVYDLVAIQNYGNRAKTNYLYSQFEINRINSIDFENKTALRHYYSSV